MIFSLLTTTLSTTVCFLYPAYASYKALSLPPSTLESERALERWLMYWAVVGSWTAIEAVVGFTFNWIPFYNIIKSLVFAFIALPQSGGSSYIYHTHLAPFFQDHERDIDMFLGSLRTRAGSAFADTLTWLWTKIRSQMNMVLPHDPPVGDQAHGPLPGQPYPTGNMSAGQPPTFHDQAGGLQRLYGVAARYAATYAPAAIGAMSRFANRAPPQAESQDQPRTRTVSGLSHYDTSQTMEMPIPRPTPARDMDGSSSSTLRSRAFAHAASSPPGGQWGDIGVSEDQDRNSSRPRPSQSQSQRSSSESLHSAHSGAGGRAGVSSGRWAEMSYEQISKDDLGSGNEGQGQGQGQGSRPVQGRRTGSGRWFSWGSGGSEQRDKSE